MATDVIEALVQWCDEQAELQELFPGGIYNTMAPTGPSTPLPYLTFIQADGKILNVIGGTKAVSWPTVAIEARAIAADQARELGAQVRDILLEAPGSLQWIGGMEAGRYETDGEGGELEEGLGPDGSDVWVHRIPMVFMTGRG